MHEVSLNILLWLYIEVFCEKLGVSHLDHIVIVRCMY